MSEFEVVERDGDIIVTTSDFCAAYFKPDATMVDDRLIEDIGAGMYTYLHLKHGRVQ